MRRRAPTSRSLVRAPNALSVLGTLQKVVIAESDLDDPTLASFIFSCERKGWNKLGCLGHALSSLEPVAMPADLVRLKNPGEGLEPIASLARERC